MFYTVTPNTRLFDELMMLKASSPPVRESAKQLVEQVGATGWSEPGHAFAGGISYFDFGEKPIPPSFKKANEHGLTFPKKIKANRALLKEIHDLPIVPLFKLNGLLNWQPYSMHPHMFIPCPHIYMANETILVKIHEKVSTYNPPEGMVEITRSEYLALRTIKEQTA